MPAFTWTILLLSLFSLLVCFYIFIWVVVFLVCRFLFQMCSSQRCGANALPHSLIICSHSFAASRKQCLRRKRKAPFLLTWLVLSAGSFGLRSVFATCLACCGLLTVPDFLKQILLLLYLQYRLGSAQCLAGLPNQDLPIVSSRVSVSQRIPGEIPVKCCKRL